MGFKYIEVVSIPVADQERALAFYRDKLGFVLVNDTMMDEKSRWVQLGVSPEQTTTITLVTWFDKMPPGSQQGLVLATDDIAAAKAQLTDRGVTVGEIMDTPWGKFADFADPDGNGWTLRQAP